MADDHMHLAVSSDGTLYAAVKTSYDTSGYPKLALLIRRPNGVWDNLYAIGTKGDGALSNGTRPFIVLNEATNTLIYAWSNTESGGPIWYREITDTGTGIILGEKRTLISGTGGHHRQQSQQRHRTQGSVTNERSSSPRAKVTWPA